MADSQPPESSPHDPPAPTNIEESSNPTTESSQAESSSSSSSTTTTTTPPTLPLCNNCSKPSPSPETKPLKPCSKCQSVQYCSRECQKSDFKKHKKVCAQQAQIYAQTADFKMETSRGAGEKKEGHRGGLQKWQFDT